MSAEIAAALAVSKSGVVVAPIVLTSDRTDLLGANSVGGDFIVAVAPANLNLFDVSGWGRYGLFFNTYVRVFDARSGVLVGHASCKVEMKSRRTAMKFDDLMADNGAGLREMIRVGGTKCVKQLLNGLKLPAA